MSHTSVLLREAVDGLNVRPGGVYFDGTLGLGGHSLEILKRGGTLIAADRDAGAIEASRERLSAYAERVSFVHANFGQISEILQKLGVDRADGVLCDFGVSSPQLDTAERGFSYTRSAPLDMRMNAEEPLTARDVVNGWDEEELRRILYDYGEERYARQIASAIVKRRAASAIETTDELAETVRSAMPGRALREKQHPAKRTFQAVRIAVNDELGEIERLLAAVPGVLSDGGRVALISFHSLEDRAVKTAFRDWSDGCVCPKELPKCVCGFVPVMKTVTKKPVVPGEAEISENPRARSAKLRIAERLPRHTARKGE
ncbi:MAG: 16S rRNA (cytosine(1402)-N(4))-methyltransferase RsmH [Oscillospiraceae bacterium]|jgi:16S rRNA (cytosine1402-N4)-methyltransferase|nr:16S rRNA (cytosine(1402)-N(4))-methyltransferase RsmH [Oscillospiraceae bacterium]